MKHLHKLLALFLCAALFFCTSFLLVSLAMLPAHADVGNVDWGEGGDGGDWGGGNDYDYDYGTSYIFSDSDSTGFSVGTVIIIVVVLLVFAYLRKKGMLKHGSTMNSGAAGTPSQSATSNHASMSEQATLDAIRALDPNFAADQFKTFASDVFLRVQEAWEAKNWTVIRPFESDKLFNLHQRQLQEFIDAKKTNYMNEQYIKQVSLAGFREDGVNEVLTVRLDATLLDYTLDDTTGRLLSGSKTARQTRAYRLEFIRTKGVKTSSAAGVEAHQCPSCGAPIELNASGVCAYCGNVVTSGEYGWVLNGYNKW